MSNLPAISTKEASCLNMVKLLAEDARVSLLMIKDVREKNADILRFARTGMMDTLLEKQKRIVEDYSSILDALIRQQGSPDTPDLREAVQAVADKHFALTKTISTMGSDYDNVRREAIASIRPPLIGEIIARLTTPPHLADLVLDSRAEAYAKNVLKVGFFRATAYYWTDVVKSCWPGLRGVARLAFDALLRWWGS